jgi:hypothetical protein
MMTMVIVLVMGLGLPLLVGLLLLAKPLASNPTKNWDSPHIIL